MVSSSVGVSNGQPDAVSSAGALSLTLDPIGWADLNMLQVGGYAPLTGFMGAADCTSVAECMRTAAGDLWPIPITLSIPQERVDAARAAIGQTASLVDEDGEIRGSLTVAEVFERDPVVEAELVYGTADGDHPGVAALLARGRWCVAGSVAQVPASAGATSLPKIGPCLTPAESRALFAERGWKRVVGFQTRNPVHRAHEYLLKCALEQCDGLFLHPLVGFTKSDDIPAAVRMRCYAALIDAVMPAERVILSVLPAPMRYAGPREAVLHALVRRNYGCTHFIVGRDHAGVGSYYDTYAAQQIFDDLPSDDVGIEILRFEHAFYCRRCGQMASVKTCPHDSDAHVFLSGTKVRAMLRSGESLPETFTRPEVAAVLAQWMAAG